MTSAPNATKIKNSQAKRWVFTLNNPKDSSMPWNEKTMDYLVYGNEVGDSGTPHHQGFVIFKASRRLSQLTDIIQAHYSVANGTNQQAADYCKKDGDYKEFGIMPIDRAENMKKQQPGGAKANHDKWREINDKAKAGDLEFIDQKYPKVFNTSYRNIKQMRTDYMKRKPDLDSVCGTWYHGTSNVGKTTLISKLYPGAYLKRAQNKWFDGYNDEDVVVVDDLDKTHTYMAYELKKLADAFCYMVEVKNDSRYIRPKKCVVTSQYTIEQIWFGEPETIVALKRRFNVIEVTKENRDILAMFKNDIIEDDKDDVIEIKQEMKKPTAIEKAFAKQKLLKEKNEVSITFHPKKPEIEIEEVDTDEYTMLDALVIEAEEEAAKNKLKTVKQKIDTSNKAKAVTQTFTPTYQRRTAPRNEYYPEKFHPYKAPRKQLKRVDTEVIEYSSDEVEEIEDDKEVYEGEHSEQEYLSMNCDEDLDDYDDNNSNSSIEY